MATYGTIVMSPLKASLFQNAAWTPQRGGLREEPRSEDDACSGAVGGSAKHAQDRVRKVVARGLLGSAAPYPLVVGSGGRARRRGGLTVCISGDAGPRGLLESAPVGIT